MITLFTPNQPCKRKNKVAHTIFFQAWFCVEFLFNERFFKFMKENKIGIHMNHYHFARTLCFFYLGFA